MIKICILIFLFLNLFQCRGEHYHDYDNYIHSGKFTDSTNNFPRARTYPNGMPKPLPVNQLESGLYLDIINEGNSLDRPPSWFNRTLAQQGRDLVKENFFSYLLGLAALDLLFYVTTPSINRVVYQTGSFSKSSPENAARRLTADVLQGRLWIESDIDGPVMKMSLAKMRDIHRRAVQRVRNVYPDIRKPHLHDNVLPTNNIDTKMWRAFRQDVEPLKAIYPFPTNRIQSLRDGTSNELPSNMYDMAASSIFITCGPLLYAKQFGINKATEEQWVGLFHLWAGISHMLGIDDNYNIHLQKDYASAIQYCSEFAEHQFVRGFVNMDDESMRAMDNIIESAMILFPYINTKAGWLLFFFTAFEIPAPHLKRVTGVIGRSFNGALEPIVHPTLKTRFGRMMANYYMKARIRVASTTFFGFNGNDEAQVAEKGWWLGKYNDEL